MTESIHKEANKHGLHFYDCPLSGGPDGAKNGTLTVMAGGDQSSFHEILTLLESIGSNVNLVGESGSGQVVKLCNNMLVAGMISLIGEVLLTAEKAGVQKEKLATMLQSGSAQTKVMDVFGPNMLDETFDHVTFSLANMQKDLYLYHSLTKSTNTSTAMSHEIQRLFETAMKKEKGHMDATVVYQELLKSD